MNLGSNRQYLCIIFLSGRAWEQTGVAYTSFRDAEAAWEAVRGYLPIGTRAETVKSLEVTSNERQ